MFNNSTMFLKMMSS